MHPTEDFTIVHNDSGSIITFLNKIWDTQTITVNYFTTSAGDSGVGTTGILPLDTQFLINEINYLGDTVTLRVVTDDSYSKWGDVSESTADTENLKAIVNTLSQEDDLVSQGIFQSGDKRFLFKSNQTSLARGNRLKHQGLWYEIASVNEFTFGDVTYSIEVIAKKI